MSNKETVRKLPMKLIKEDYDKFKEVVDIDFEEDGKSYRVKLFPYFEPQRVNSMIDRFGKDMKKINDTEGLKFPDELIPSYLLLSILEEFSDFPLPKTDDIKKKVSYFTQVINTKYFKIVTDSLVQEEVSAVWDKIMQVMKESEKLTRMISKVQNEIQDLDLQSPELKERLQPKRIPEA